jgi:hypothetical protein
VNRSDGPRPTPLLAGERLEYLRTHSTYRSILEKTDRLFRNIDDWIPSTTLI